MEAGQKVPYPKPSLQHASYRTFRTPSKIRQSKWSSIATYFMRKKPVNFLLCSSSFSSFLGQPRHQRREKVPPFPRLSLFLSQFRPPPSSCYTFHCPFELLLLLLLLQARRREIRRNFFFPFPPPPPAQQMVAKRKRGREERPNGEGGGRGGGGKGNLPPPPLSPSFFGRFRPSLRKWRRRRYVRSPPLFLRLPFSLLTGWVGWRGGKFFMQARYAFSASSTLDARWGGRKRRGRRDIRQSLSIELKGIEDKLLTVWRKCG